MAWKPKQQINGDQTAKDPSGSEVIREDTLGAQENNYSLIGRKGSGKSLLVGTLLNQAHNSIHSFEHLTPHITGRGEEAKQLKRKIDQMVEGETLPPTHVHRFYRHDITLQCRDLQAETSSGWFRNSASENLNLKSAKFTITDAAGELLMGAAAAQQGDGAARTTAKQFNDIVRRSKGIIYCMPAIADEEINIGTARKQHSVIDELDENEDLHVERIIICFTMYDALWQDRHSEAFDFARDRDTFISIARDKMLPEGVRKSLDALVERRLARGRLLEICLCPVSVFGFVDKNGCINFNPETDGLLATNDTKSSGGMANSLQQPYSVGEILDYWRPFYIVDPFVFAAFGDKGDLTIDLADLQV